MKPVTDREAMDLETDYMMDNMVRPKRCPDCGGPLVYSDSIAMCPICGFSNPEEKASG